MKGLDMSKTKYAYLSNISPFSRINLGVNQLNFNSFISSCNFCSVSFDSDDTDSTLVKKLFILF